ncbi:hypothetical protein JTB14_010902 [Gonioctena quinquepunctata]|nr:hypothetical protein JTB14_010902 [Gonioctena quinquepunctata]
MGICFSKKDSDYSGNGVSRSDGASDGEEVDIRVETVVRYDEHAIRDVTSDLKNRPHMFLLNNLLMSTHFFENYQKDIAKLMFSTTNKMETELNRSLLKDEMMECTCPDVIFEKVNRNIRIRPLHGWKKTTPDLLVARRLFVINDKIEVVSSEDIPQYTSIDKPSYLVKIEESSRKGFIRLRYIDTNKLPKRVYHPTPSEIYEPLPGTSNNSDSEFYEYTTITNLKTPKPLAIEKEPERRETLPETCFTTRKIEKADADMPDKDEVGEDVEYSEEDLFDKVTYIDAKGFMRYFKNVQFPNSLGRALGFDATEIELAKSIPGKIFCNLADEEDNPLPCEIIPSVAIPWPAEQTFEFKMREDRPTITDTRTGTRYRWPTDEMIKEITSLSCVAIPKGYWRKKGQYTDATIEWEIAFPKAERYMEARMSNAQLRCFLFLLVLHKTYIEPRTKQHGLLVEHIRCHMYWECEANYGDWPEHRLGYKLSKVIRNLSNRLAVAELPDYFIRRNNHFRNIPKMYLQVAQKVFHEVLQAPTMYFLRALRNIRYTSGKFYSPLDFKDLYKTLNPNNRINIVKAIFIPNFKQKRYANADTQWKHLKELENRKRYIEQTMKQEQKEERRESVDSIDLDWVCDKKFDIYKTRNILVQFIEIFIDLARDSSRLATKDQTLFFLKQAYYLTRILENTSIELAGDVREYLKTIKAQEEDCKKRIASNEDVPPMTPVRNSIHFDNAISQQLRNNLVNLNNLNMSFNMAGGTSNANVRDSSSSGTIVKSNSGANIRESQSFHLPKMSSLLNRMKSVDLSMNRRSVTFVAPKR